MASDLDLPLRGAAAYGDIPFAVVAEQTPSVAGRLVARLFSSFETGDRAVFASVWADDAVLEWPFAVVAEPGKSAPARRGKADILALFKDVVGRKSYRMHDLMVLPMRDERDAYVEWLADITMQDSGRTYTSHYAGVAETDGQKITRLRELYHSAHRQKFEGDRF